MKKDTLRLEALAMRETFLQTDTSSLNYQLRKESIDSLRMSINKVALIADLDEDKMAKRIAMAISPRNEYGKVPGLMNLLATIVNWPTDDNNVDGLNEVREEILSTLGVTATVFEDLREAKGYHTFVSDEHEIIDGVEPAFDEYTMLVQMLAAELGLAVVDLKLDDSSWATAETVAIKKAGDSIARVRAELEEHKKLHGDK